ncbi:hypothetical protein L3X38_010644 [Prunus dulcis]|uniref:Uncharacterized protein n=1 Tax=Prunus dulcis TaxID=3755 RepID=A0AAD4WFX4_PRUDU|nr:hypothetical protein L3X38_010644 [Prunus dulcis]
MYPCDAVNSPGRSRRHTVYLSRKSWQDTGDYSQPDPLAGLGDTKSAEPQILALKVRASPKLVRQCQVH